MIYVQLLLIKDSRLQPSSCVLQRQALPKSDGTKSVSCTVTRVHTTSCETLGQLSDWKVRRCTLLVSYRDSRIYRIRREYTHSQYIYIYIYFIHTYIYIYIFICIHNHIRLRKGSVTQVNSWPKSWMRGLFLQFDRRFMSFSIALCKRARFCVLKPFSI